MLSLFEMNRLRVARPVIRVRIANLQTLIRWYMIIVLAPNGSRRARKDKVPSKPVNGRSAEMDRLAAGVETGQQPVRIATRRPETSTRRQSKATRFNSAA